LVCTNIVMAGLDPAIHVLGHRAFFFFSFTPGSSPLLKMTPAFSNAARVIGRSFGLQRRRHGRHIS
jgi:hypothetical protein